MWKGKEGSWMYKLRMHKVLNSSGTWKESLPFNPDAGNDPIREILLTLSLKFSEKKNAGIGEKIS